jgi:hypothetical protein
MTTPVILSLIDADIAILQQARGLIAGAASAIVKRRPERPTGVKSMSSDPMRLRFITMWTALAMLAGAVGTSAQSAPPRQVNVAIDPRSEGEAQSELIVKGFGNSCPNVSIIRDETKAEYVILASESNPWRGFLLHYYITVYDKQGKVVFATDKHHDKNASEAACRFINAQK